MCGIAGIYRRGSFASTDATKSEDRALVERMLETLRYRGPDDGGIESLGRLTFGARRLSILDVAGGHQPLSDAQGRVWAVQNGEIYNFPQLRADLAKRHPLRTRTDTELLPHLYLERGAGAVSALSGMFAAAIYDTRDETLLLARDPMGVKPLYVAERGDRVLFASELKALMCDPEVGRDLDLDALARYLALGFVPGTATVLRSVRKVRPGTHVRFGPHERTVERYRPWPSFFGDPRWAGASIESMSDEVARRLSESTVSMLLSDRPLGVLLSGGLDSSVMVALLPEEVRRQTHTFAIGFENAGYHDERGHARAVASHLGTRHHEYVVDVDLAAELPRVVTFLDEPYSDPATVPAHLVARAAASEVTVLLSGTGGDEVFGGYRRHRLAPLLHRLGWLPRGIAAAGARALSNRDQHRHTRSAERMIMARKLLEARGRSSFFEAYLSAFESAPPARWREALEVATDPGAIADALRREMTAELGGWPEQPEAIGFAFDHLHVLADGLLLKEDRTTMGASVEGRVPFLDPSLVEFAAGLPLASRFEGGQGKRLLRHIGRRLLPPGIADRPKHGFSVPVEAWLRGPLRDLAGDVFAGEGSGVFRMERLRQWHDLHQRGIDRSGPLWTALCFELWWNRVASPAAVAVSAAPSPGGA